MTYEEQQQYNKLSYRGKQIYDRIKRENPEYNHKAIYLKTVLEVKIEEGLTGGGADIDPKDFWDAVLKGARRFLESVGNIARDVFVTIDRALSKVADWIGRGIEVVVDFLDDLFS